LSALFESQSTNPKKIIFFDIDGTLYSGRIGGPFREDLDVIEEAAALGHLMFLNTGRSFANIPEFIANSNIWSGICAGGGAHILFKESITAKIAGEYIDAKYGSKTFYHKWIEKEFLSKICGWYLENDKLIVLEGEKYCYATFPSRLDYNINPLRTIGHRDDFISRYTDDLVTKMTVNGSFSAEETELIEGRFTINTFPHYTELVLMGEDKGKAIGIVLDALCLDRKNSIAIGDNINDIDMLKFAGIGIAMGNADDTVKAEADFVTGNCGEGGVADAIRRYVL